MAIRITGIDEPPQLKTHWVIESSAPWRDSKGCNGLIRTKGVEILYQARPKDESPRDYDHAVLLFPITTRGVPSESCRLAVAKSAIPEIIEALQIIQRS